MKTSFFNLSFILSVAFLQAQLPSYVPVNGLKGFWPFCGNAIDVSGYGHNGTVSGAVLCADRFNMAANAYSLNGAGFISTAMTGILGNNPRAVSFWAKTNDGQSTMCGVSWGDEQSSPNFGVRYECAFNYVLTGASFIGADCAITYSTPSPVNDNLWHHYVFQYGAGPDITFVQVYQDGALLTGAIHQHNPNASVNTSANWSVNFGRIPYSIPHFFTGALDEIGIWDRVLTINEIQQLHAGNESCKASVDDVAESSREMGICVYPNPNSGHFAVKPDRDATVIVFSALGQVVRKGVVTAGNPLEICCLPPGIYVLKIQESEGYLKVVVE
jgi:hypothetical protein